MKKSLLVFIDKKEKNRTIAIFFFIVLFLCSICFLSFFEKGQADTLLDDSFSGTTINTTNWIEHDSGSQVNQNNALTIVGNGSWNTNGLESQSSLSRDGLIITSQAKVADAAHDQIVLAYGDWNWTGANSKAYIVYLDSSGNVSLRYFSNGSLIETASAGTYAGNTIYTFKVVLRTTGAYLYIDRGSGYPTTPDATLNQGTFTTKKVSIEGNSGTQTNYNITVNNITTSDVSGFSSVPGNGINYLTWTNPSDSGFTGTMIRYRTDTYPTSATDGSLLIDLAASPGSVSTTTHSGITNNTSYYYAAFAHDSLNEFGSSTQASSTPLSTYILSDPFSFDVASSTTWTTIGNTTTGGNGMFTIQAPAVAGWNQSGIKTVSTFDRDITIITKGKWPSAIGTAAPIGYGDTYTNVSGGPSGQSIWLVAYGGNFYCTYSQNNTNPEFINSNVSVVAGVDYTFKLVLDPTSGGSFYVDSGSGFTHLCDVSGGSFSNKPVFSMVNSGGDFSLDYTLVQSNISGPSVVFTNPQTNLTVHDQFYDFDIPWIQTSPTLDITVNTSSIPSGGGIKYVVDEGTDIEKTATSLVAPYSVSIANIAKGEHTLKAYILDSDGVTPLNGSPDASLSNIAIGDIVVLVGDSTTAGHAGSQVSGPVTSCAGSTYHTADCRTYEQSDGDGGEIWKSFHVDLASKLETYYGYPVFIMNEGWGGSDTHHFNTTIATASQFQERMVALQPNKVLINEGVNDARCENGGCSYPYPATASLFEDNLETIVGLFEDTYDISADNIYIARYSYDTSLTAYATDYLNAISAAIDLTGVKHGADIYDFIKNHQSYLTDIVHPNAAGFVEEARIWALALMHPNNLTAQRSGSDIALSWNKLESIDSTVAGYKIYYGTAPSDLNTVVDVGNASSTTITSGITNDQTYYFAVQGYDNDPYQTNLTATSSVVSVAYGQVDDTSPAVSITSPTADEVVSGSSVSLTALASDDTGVAGVQFKLDDNTNIGAEDTTSAYEVSWDSTAVSEGAHTLRAVARDAAGNYATSTSVTVTVDNTAPVRSGGSPNNTLPYSTTATTISLSTNEAATCAYSATSNTSYGSMTPFGTTGGTSHSATISGLSNNNSYTYYVRCQDAEGNVNNDDYPISFSVASDTTAPVISSINTSTNTATATITWTTDEPASSQVVYGTSESYGSQTLLDSTLVTGHSVALSNLSADTTYHFAATSADTYSNSSTSLDQTFTTAPSDSEVPQDTTPPRSVHISGSQPSRSAHILSTPPASVNVPPPAVCLRGMLFNSLTGASCPSIVTPPAAVLSIDHDLQFGDTRAEVKLLQLYLNAQGFTVSLSGAGSKGNETAIFGPATKAALIAFQKAKGIKPAAGYFGPITRNYIFTH